MESVGKQSKRQHQVEEENKQLDEATKKKQKRQLEEMNRLEQAASRNFIKQRKQAIEIHWLEHVVKKRSQLTTNKKLFNQ